MSYKVFIDYTGRVTGKSTKPSSILPFDVPYELRIENLPNWITLDDVRKVFSDFGKVKKIGSVFHIIFQSLKTFRDSLSKNIEIRGIKVEMDVCVRALRPAILIDSRKVTKTRKGTPKFEKIQRSIPGENIQTEMQAQIIREASYQRVRQAARPRRASPARTSDFGEENEDFFCEEEGSRASDSDEDPEEDSEKESKADMKFISSETQFKRIIQETPLQKASFRKKTKKKEEKVRKSSSRKKTKKKEEKVESEEEEEEEKAEMEEEREELEEIDNVVATAAAPNENFRNETILLEAWLMLDEHLKQHTKELTSRKCSDLKRGIIPAVRRGTVIQIDIDLNDKSCQVHPKRDRAEWNGKRQSSDYYIKVPKDFSENYVIGRLMIHVLDGRDKCMELRFKIPISKGSRSRHCVTSLTAEELSYIHALLVNADFTLISEDKWHLPKALESFKPFKERTRFQEIQNILTKLQAKALETHDTLKPHFENAIRRAVCEIRDEIFQCHISKDEIENLIKVEKSGSKEFEKIYHHVWNFIAERDSLEEYRNIVIGLRQLAGRNSNHDQPHGDTVKLILDAKIARSNLFNTCSEVFSEMKVVKDTSSSKLVKSPVKKMFRICEKIAFLGLHETVIRNVDRSRIDGSMFVEVTDLARVFRSRLKDNGERIYDVQLKNGTILKCPESFLFPLSTSSSQEVSMKNIDRTNHANSIRDIARIMIVFSTMNEIAEFAKLLANRTEVKILRIKDRFLSTPSSSGWRDLMINLSISSGSRHHKKACHVEEHVCEIQIVHNRLLHARKGLPGHEVYSKVRNAIEILELMPFSYGDGLV